MSKALDQQQEFLERYQTQKELVEGVANPEEQVLRKKRNLRLLFRTWIGFLTLTPFVASYTFIVALTRVKELFGNQAMSEVTGKMTESELNQFGTEMGFDNLSDLIGLYNHRGVIVAGIFSVFILLILVSFLTRFALNRIRF